MADRAYQTLSQTPDVRVDVLEARQRIRGLPEYALDLSRVDYARVASAMGLAAATITEPEQLRPALQQAMIADRATLIDVQVDARPYQDGFGPTTGVAVSD